MHKIKGNTIKSGNGYAVDLKRFQDDTIVASKKWCKENKEELEKWINS